MEEAEKKEQELLIMKKNEGWLGSRKTGEPEAEVQKPKVNPWVMAAQKDAKTGVQFAPLKPSVQETKLVQSSARQEQEFVFVSKAEQAERKKKR